MAQSRILQHSNRHIPWSKVFSFGATITALNFNVDYQAQPVPGQGRPMTRREPDSCVIFNNHDTLQPRGTVSISKFWPQPWPFLAAGYIKMPSHIEWEWKYKTNEENWLGGWTRWGCWMTDLNVVRRAAILNSITLQLWSLMESSIFIKCHDANQSRKKEPYIRILS